MAWGWIGSKLTLRIYALKKKSIYCIRVHFSEKLGLVWINTYMCVYTYVYTYVYVCIYIYVYIHIHMCVCTHTHTHTYICTYIYTHIYIHIHTEIAALKS